MLKIYPDAIVGLFGPLVGLADAGAQLDSRLRPSIVTEDIAKQIYERELKPHYESLDHRLQEACKLALRYILNATDYDHRNEFRAMLLPFDYPNGDPKNLFLWLWDILFPQEQPVPFNQHVEVIRGVNVWRHILEGY